ncbi:hypothetical protein BKM32_09785 [Mangrovimonas sp. DI 80]|nr:hypothetical protein BKM32_09785 [Mangrovimonas sp. DI 80]
MRSIYTILFILSIFITGCNASKKENTMSYESHESEMKNTNSLEGTWEANYIMGGPKDFSDIYPHGAPKITFDLEKETTAGQTGCNNFSGPIKIDGNSIQFNEAMAVTRKMCPDMTGEKLFLDTLKKINKFSISEEGHTLNLIIGDIAAMKLHKL